MAIVTRYFSTTAAGLGDGTSWANRAALFSSGNWSSVITGFNFSGSDSLEARIEGGLTYTCSQAMASGLFANAPSVANSLLVHGCDSSGNLLEPPDRDWLSAQGTFSTSTLPVIATTTNIITANLANSFWRLIAYTASGANGAIANTGNYDWCSFTNSTANTSAGGVNNPTSLRNSQIIMSGASFSYGLNHSGASQVSNVRLDGSAGVTSGSRIGVNTSSAGMQNSEGLTILNFAGGGFLAATGAAGRYATIRKCTFYGNASYGFRGNSTASQTVYHQVVDSVFVDNAIGIDGQSAARILVSNCRLRDNTNNFSGMGNFPETWGVDIASGNDSDEFVDVSGGDYRIKNTSTIWGKGWGAGDEPSAGSGGSALHLGGLGQTGIGVF